MSINNYDFLKIQKKYGSEYKLFEMKKPKIPESWGRIDDVCRLIFFLRKLKELSIEGRVNIEIVLFLSSNGVTNSKVSAYSKDIELNIFKCIDEGNAPINLFTEFLGYPLTVIDVGVNSSIKWRKIVDYKISKGTKNILYFDAMTESEFERAINTGRKVAKDIIDKSTDIVCLGEMGLGNTTTSSIILALLMDLEASDVVGNGSGVSGEIKSEKFKIIERCIESYKVNNNSSIDILEVARKLGGFEINADVGFILKAAKSGTLIFVDGFITSVAAYIAWRIDSSIEEFLIFSSLSTEPGHKFILEELNKEPLLSLNLRMGQCSAAVFAISLLQPAFKFYFENSS